MSTCKGVASELTGLGPRPPSLVAISKLIPEVNDWLTELEMIAAMARAGTDRPLANVLTVQRVELRQRAPTSALEVVLSLSVSDRKEFRLDDPQGIIKFSVAVGLSTKKSLTALFFP